MLSSSSVSKKEFTSKLMCHLCGCMVKIQEMTIHIANCISEAIEPLPYEYTKNVLIELTQKGVNGRKEIIKFNNRAMDIFVRFKTMICKRCKKYVVSEMKELHHLGCPVNKLETGTRPFIQLYEEDDYCKETLLKSKKELWSVKTKLINSNKKRRVKEKEGKERVSHNRSKSRELLISNDKKSQYNDKSNKSRSREVMKKQRPEKKTVLPLKKKKIEDDCNSFIYENYETTYEKVNDIIVIDNSFKKDISYNTDHGSILKSVQKDSFLKQKIDSEKVAQVNQIKSFKKTEETKPIEKLILKHRKSKGSKRESKVTVDLEIDAVKELRKEDDKMTSFKEDIKTANTELKTFGGNGKNTNFLSVVEKRKAKKRHSEFAFNNLVSRKFFSMREVQDTNFNMIEEEAVTINCRFCERGFKAERVYKHELVCLKGKDKEKIELERKLTH